VYVLFGTSIRRAPTAAVFGALVLVTAVCWMVPVAASVNPAIGRTLASSSPP